jgi:hypothetical protein
MAITPVRSIHKLNGKSETTLTYHFNFHTRPGKKPTDPQNHPLTKVNMNREKKTIKGKTENGESHTRKEGENIPNLHKQQHIKQMKRI